jgi:hypothetical protein
MIKPQKQSNTASLWHVAALVRGVMDKEKNATLDNYITDVQMEGSKTILILFLKNLR